MTAGFGTIFGISAVLYNLRVTAYDLQNRQKWFKLTFLDRGERSGVIRGSYGPFWGLCETLPVPLTGLGDPAGLSGRD